MKLLGNIMATAWSATGRLGIVGRAGWTGPARAVVLDGDFVERANVEVPGDPTSQWAAAWFDGDELVASVGVPVRSVVVASAVDKRVIVFDGKTGKRIADHRTANTPRSAGTLANGRLWILESNGRLTFGDRVFDLGALCIDMKIAPEETRAVVRMDLLDLKSAARVIDLENGATLWESKAKKKPSPPNGVTVKGEAMFAKSKDKSRLIVVDDDGLRLFDRASGTVTTSFSNKEIEDWTIDPIDKPLFDENDVPCVKVGAHMYRVERDRLVAIPRPKT